MRLSGDSGTMLVAYDLETVREGEVVASIETKLPR